MFFKIIAIIFLIIFLIKLFSIKTIPFLKKTFNKFIDFCTYTFKLWVKSSLYTLHLLYKRTVYVIGLDILFALIFNFILMLIVNPAVNIRIWFKLYFRSLFNTYVFSFFFFTYIIGLFTYLKDDLPFKFSNFIFFKKTSKSNATYIYDEKTNQYIYRK